MFLIPVCCFALGLLAMGRTKPTTKVAKMVCLGPKTGAVYQVEDFREIGVVVVRAPGGAIAQFVRAAVRTPGATGLIYQQGRGDAEALKAIAADFSVPARAPSAVAASRETRASSGAKP